MKRLLSYLLIVLGLGSVSGFNDVAYASSQEFKVKKISSSSYKGNDKKWSLVKIKEREAKARKKACLSAEEGARKELFDKAFKAGYEKTNLDWESKKILKIRRADPERMICELEVSMRFKKAVTDNTQTKVASNLEEEKKKIAEEKRKIEEEKRKIAEAKKKQEEEAKERKEANAKLYVIGSGTGFFVSSEGHVVSNDHVVGICRTVATKIEGEINYFNILNTDEVNDLGLIKGDYKSKNFLNIKSGGAEFGEDIVAFGYPLSDALSTSVKLTRGIVSSLSGPGNNYSEIQIDAAIQPGNSGGPVLNMEGQVVGVASSGLNKIRKLLDENSPYIPENVNFAVASPIVVNILKSQKVKYTKPSFFSGSYSSTELAEYGNKSTIQLFCRNTLVAYKKLKSDNKYSTVLLDLE